MQSFNFSSCMAASADLVCRAIAGYITERSIPTKFVDDISWQERERFLDEEQIQACWICGLPYVWKADQTDANIELLVAPIMRGTRYQQSPIYFSDVIVHRGSRFKTFADLRGASWAYNEPRSHSGCNLVSFHLATLGETSQYFAEVTESGTHERSLEMILSHQIDASAIDSTVLELQLERYPEIRSDIRIIETLGPSPIPPWVIVKSVPQELRAALRELLLKMHKDPQGRAILAEGRIDRFVRVEDRDYDAIRHMSRRAQPAALPVAKAESDLCRVEMRACRQTLQARNNLETAA